MFSKDRVDTEDTEPKSKRRWLLAGLIAVLCIALVFILSGWVLRQIAIGQIIELTGGRVKAESVDFNRDGSVLIKKLLIGPYRRAEYDDTILKAETVYARFGIGSLLLLRPRLKELSISDFVLDGQYDADTGRWNLAALRIEVPKGPRRGQMPDIRLERGELRYSMVSGGKVKVVAAAWVDGKLGSAAAERDGYSFAMSTDKKSGSGKSKLAGLWQPGKIKVAGDISSLAIPGFVSTCAIALVDAELVYDPNKNFSFKLMLKDLVSELTSSGPALVSKGPAFADKPGPFTALQKLFIRYQPYGRFDIGIKAWGNLGRIGKSTLVGEVHCKDVLSTDQNFLYPVENIVGRIDFTEDSAVLNDLLGRHGDVRMTFSGSTKGFGENWQYQIKVASDNMVLDEGLYSALNANQQEFWSSFSPSGRVVIDYRINRKSETDVKRILVVEPLGIEAKYVNFPYPLRNVRGKLSFVGDKIAFSDLVSEYGGRKITVNGEVTGQSAEQPKHDLIIIARDVPLDAELGAALPVKQRRLYNQFDMNGLGDAEVKVFTPEQGQELANFIADVTLKDTTLRSKELPLAISGISAKAVCTPDVVRIEDFNGQYGEGLVSVTGQIWPSEEANEPAYCLTLRAEEVELYDDLVDLLPTPVAKIVSELQPGGKISFSADLNKDSRVDCNNHGLTVECMGVTIYPKSFPYPLRDITGTLTIAPDSIKLKGITATTADSIRITPGTGTIRLDGEIELDDDGFSSGRFRLSASDVFFDKRLGIALPGDIGDLYSRLSPTGRFGLDFEKIEVSKAEDGKKQADFAGELTFKDCGFKTSPAISDLNAVLQVEGTYRTGDGFSKGRASLSADRLKIKGKSVTGLKAEIQYDPPQRRWWTENLVGGCYGGKVTGKFELRQPGEEALAYLLQVGFHNIDLRQFLSETNGKSRVLNGESYYSSGKMNGSLSVSGKIGESSGQIGRCRLMIRDMEVGKLSPLAKLLYVLRLTEPKDFAFEQMFVDSYIKHGRLFFEKFDLSGKALAFSGSGSMDLRSQEVDLILTARGRRLADAEPSILQSLAEDLGGAVVRIEVTGNANDPQVEIRTLPLFRDSLRILGKRRP